MKNNKHNNKKKEIKMIDAKHFADWLEETHPGITLTEEHIKMLVMVHAIFEKIESELSDQDINKQCHALMLELEDRFYKG